MLSGEMAAKDRSEIITEGHLLRAFLSVESSALRILEEKKVNLALIRETAERYVPQEEEKEDPRVAGIETVRQRLRERLVGQDEAIERVLPAVQRVRFGFTTPERPIGVFLFCGQSGSGKTEMAKELARAVYGSEDNLIFLEMGQFNSSESMNIFVGAPPGYIGYGEGKLTNGLRDKPRSVVLFDEVDKVQDPRVLDALLRFLDEGKIDDPAGPVRDGSQCIVILTSNAGADQLSQLATELERKPEGHAVIRKQLREIFKRHGFRVEFLNRVDELVLFKTLEKEDYIEITRRFLGRILERLAKERGMTIRVDPEVYRRIGNYCHTLNEGARAAHRLVWSVVISPAIDFALGHDCTPPIMLSVKTSPQAQSPHSEPAAIVEFP
jgi:ATP-dependent Clp protease ATP-binding subunit ClpC